MLHIAYKLTPKFKSPISYEAASLNAVEDELTLGDSIESLKESDEEYVITISHFFLDQDYQLCVKGSIIKSKQGRLFKVKFSEDKSIIIEKLGKKATFNINVDVYECTNAKSWTSKLYKRWVKINSNQMPISIEWE